MTRGEYAVISCARETAAAAGADSLVPSPPGTSDRVEFELTLESMIQVWTPPPRRTESSHLPAYCIWSTVYVLTVRFSHWQCKRSHHVGQQADHCGNESTGTPHDAAGVLLST